MLAVKFRYFSALMIIVAEKQCGNSNFMKTARGERRQQFYYTAQAIFSPNEIKCHA